MEKYFEGIGRRKTSTARVRIYKGDKASTITELYIIRPLTVSGLETQYYFTAKVSGGGITGQADAIRLGLARAICLMNPEAKPALRKENLVTRDPREVERKKYHHVKARKKPQFSKR
ncbi:MAG: 30S ribosomal protein S9 [candidate division WS6 bacterium GW2011_GWE1_36_69]|nr:MAG: 30S ribosomal protein S9 [candidate division WS6 bacterium GW2011_GWE1_36_69]